MSPTTNAIAGMPSASFNLSGTNLLGVNFRLGDNNCSTNSTRIFTSSQTFQLTIKCDVPSTPTGTTSLSIRESTNGSEVSGVAGTTITLVNTSTLPTITAFNPLTVKPGSKFSFAIAGTHVNSFNGNINGLGVQYNGKTLSCTPWVNDVNADNTSGNIVDCSAPTTLGSGQLRWFFNADKSSVDFGTLTIAN